MFMEEADKSRRVQKHHEHHHKRTELESIAQWARDNTSPNAAFLTDRIEFRMLSRRAIVASRDDVRYVYYLAPWRLADWIQQLRKLRSLLQEADGEALKGFTAELAGRDTFKGVGEWYVILQACAAPDQSGILEPISGNWGQHYCLYRLR